MYTTNTNTTTNNNNNNNNYNNNIKFSQKHSSNKRENSAHGELEKAKKMKAEEKNWIP